MEEPITFWLDNKISSGLKVAEIGSQTLVSYRDKFYVIEKGAAKMKGVRPLHYSKTSLPTIWKKALRGIQPPDAVSADKPDDGLPEPISISKERPRMKKISSQEPESVETGSTLSRLPPVQAGSAPEPGARKAPRKPEPKPQQQSVVNAACPYCNHRHELPLDRGKNGKPFFVACTRCAAEFAVRYVPVTVFQAQVAAFR